MSNRKCVVCERTVSDEAYHDVYSLTIDVKKARVAVDSRIVFLSVHKDCEQELIDSIDELFKMLESKGSELNGG